MRFALVGFCLVAAACASDSPTSPSSLASENAATEARGGSDLPFRGTFEASETASGPGGAQHHLEGTGNATHLGRFTITSDFTVNATTVTAAGTAIWTAANGDQIFTDATGQGVVSFPTLTTDETHTITGGTGRFEGASGTLAVERSINLPTLTSSATITGTISPAH